MTQETNESEELARFSSMTSDLHKALECPLCLEVVSVPVMCRGGHVTCSSCVQKLSECSVCQQGFSTDVPTFLNGLLDVLPRFCKYSDNGCKQVCVSSDDHENFCSFRGISCRQKGCGEKVPVCQMKKHYQDLHPDRCLVFDADQTLWWHDFIPGQFKADNSPVFLDGHFFYISLKNNTEEKNLKYSFEAFLCGTEKCEYFITITFDEGKDFVHKRTIQAITMKGDRDNQGLELMADTENSEDYFVKLSHKFFSLIYGVSGRLRVNFKILKL